MTKNQKDIFMYLLAALITIGFFAVLSLVLFFEIPLENKAMFNIILGSLVAQWGVVVAYFYGSSKGSSDKDELKND